MISIDEEAGLITVEEDGKPATYRFDSPRAFSIMSDLWLRAGWWVKHTYTFSWLGRPIIQLPEDIVRLQELIFRIQPDVIIETGVAHGGSLVFYASLCKALERGRVIGIDIEIRPHNRRAIEAHPLFPYITLIEGNSVDPQVVDAVRQTISPDSVVLVMLDSNHTKDHVLAELRAYGPLVSVGSYIVAMDGSIMELVAGGPRTGDDWSSNNAAAAAREFVRDKSEFMAEEPAFPFNEGLISEPVSYWRGGYLKRIR